MGVLLAYSLPLLFLTLFTTANLFITTVGEEVCTKSKKSTLLIFFGDSFFDFGYNKSVLCVPSTYPPYGKSLETQPATGRFSDGLVVPDYIAKYLGLADHEGKVVAYKGTLDSQVEGNGSLSFAMAGAAAKKPGKKSKLLSAQVTEFHKYLEEVFVGNGAKLLKDGDRALYLFSIGTHDYLAQFRNIENEQDVQRVADDVTTEIVEQVKKIAEHPRGQRFAFMSVALRYLPVFRKEYYKNDTRLQLLDKLETAHYEKLNEKLEKLARCPEMATGQGPIFKYSILRYHSIIKAIMERPEEYGFDRNTVTSACCGDGFYKADDCGHLDKEGCNDPTAHVFWDGMHNTQHINQEVARIFWNGPTDTTYPHNLLTLAGTEKLRYDFSVNTNDLLGIQSVPK